MEINRGFTADKTNCSSAPVQIHLNQFIKVFRINRKLQTGNTHKSASNINTEIVL